MSFTLRPYKKQAGLEIDITLLLPNGERLRERVKSPVAGRAASKRWAEEREAFLIRNNGAKKAIVPEDPKVVRVKDLLPLWEERLLGARLKPGTLAHYHKMMGKHVQPIFGEEDVTGIGKIEVEKVKSLLRKGPSTVNAVMAITCQLLSLACALGHRGPAPELEYLPYLPPEVEPYEPEEYEQLLSCSLDTPQRRLICLLGGDAGLRCSEIAALHRADVDLVHGFLSVKNNLSDGELTTPKTRKSKRRVELTRRLREALRSQLKSHAAPTVCITKEGEMLTRHQVAREVRWAEKSARLVDKSAGPFAKVHKLRHTFGTRLAAKGATTKEIAELLGHSTTRTTEIYLHLAKVDRGRAIRLLDGEILETRG